MNNPKHEGGVKKTLPQYIESRTGVDVTDAVSPKKIKNGFKEMGEVRKGVVQQLLNNMLDDIVASATVVRTYASRIKEQSSFVDICRLLEGFPLAGTPCALGENISTVTLLTASNEGAHLKLVHAYAAALLTVKHIDKVQIVFTGEWAWHIWQRSGSSSFVKPFRQAFYEHVRNLPSMQPYMGSLDNRLEILIAPRPEAMASSLGDVLIRFEGPSPIRTTFIYGKAIFDSRPVVTATFSSYVTAPRNSDVVLVRGKPDGGQCQVYFIPPATVSYPVVPASLDKRKDRLLVTVYAGDRIKNGLAGMSNEEWGAFANLFRSVPNAKWLLIGAANPDEARSKIPTHVEKNFGENIEILPYSDLEKIYEKACVFLAFPQVFGGGGASTMAIAHGVPVLVVSDPRSDIANFVSNKFHAENFVCSIELAIKLLNNDDAWHQYIKNQQDDFMERMDFKSKGAELFGVLKKVWLARREARQGGVLFGCSAKTLP